ncbi:hypothetical protein QBC37DRAFT_430773 [Rhypophila decipiens]|uniref:Uncharacterized protein n=1 Tax=Rhypophila decipiens TaxID=261697 RepID=A0AAN6XYX4_9PEZI|nr:hypothetical protein QBC37DRAFT_430773 [Rhypophila decipiens]
MCCSDETISSSRVGARVDLSSPTGQGQIGNLLFLNPAFPGSSQATHVQFTSGIPCSSHHQHHDYDVDEEGDDMIMVSIHKSGDLTKPVSESGLLQQFALPLPPSHNLELTTTQLETSVSLEVGGDGIIGRRVTIHQGRKHLADGIVGFNSAPILPSSFTSLSTATNVLVVV